MSLLQIELTALRCRNSVLEVLDQTLLPQTEKWISVSKPAEMISAIKKLQVRGAPLIGVAASFSVAVASLVQKNKTELLRIIEDLNAARPTAVNLMNCMARMRKVIEDGGGSDQLCATAMLIAKEDIDLCYKIAELGAELIQDGDGIITHCNTGSLATAGVGTAFGIIRLAHSQGKKIHVYVDETRPLLQGGRLTAWECEKFKIPYTLIADNMAGFVMAQKRINKAFVGSDRIAMNGDFANKIGTYSLAVLANYHQVDFYVAAPMTTCDVHCATGKDIPIEERNANEVRGVSGQFGDVIWAPSEAKVYNPSFDVTPASLVKGWVLDTGVYTQEDIKNKKLLKKLSESTNGVF